VLCRSVAGAARGGGAGCAQIATEPHGCAEESGETRTAAVMRACKFRPGSTNLSIKSQFSSNLRADGLVCLAVAGLCFGTHRSRFIGIRMPARQLSPSSNGRRGFFGGGRRRRSNAVLVRATRGAPATPIRAYSSIGQSPRLITGLFLVRVQVGLLLFSGARSRTYT
jgi:hypothetical protein